MNKRLIFMLFLLCRTFLYCQTDSLETEPYVYFNAFSINAGLTGIEYQPHPVYHTNNLLRENMGLSFHLKTKEYITTHGNFSSEWKYGLNISSDLSVTQGYNNAAMDSAYIYQYYSKNTYLDITKTYHTNQQKRISFYTGINFGAGYTFNNILNTTFSSRTSSKSESTKLQSEWYYNTTIPFGILLRGFDKEIQNYSKLAFFIEARVGYRFQKNYTPAYSSIPIVGLQIGAKLHFKSYKS